MKLTRVRKRKYIDEGGNKCPFCGSEELEGKRYEADSTVAWREVECVNCKKRWEDVYTLSDIEEI